MSENHSTPAAQLAGTGRRSMTSAFVSWSSLRLELDVVRLGPSGTSCYRARLADPSLLNLSHSLLAVGLV